jgi:hypothetical protein
MSVLTIDFPETVSVKLSKLAGKDKSEMEKFILIAVAEKLNYLEERADRPDLEELAKTLATVPKVEPEEIDKIR